MKNKIENLISKLLNLQKRIDINGGVEKNGELFEEYLTLQAKITSEFGLPNSFENAQIFSLSKRPSEKEVEDFLDLLHKKAKEYLLSTPMSEIDLLEDSIKSKVSAENIFPKLGISTHIYTYFVYYEVLLKKKDSPASVFEALKLADKSDILNILGILALSNNFDEEEKSMLDYLNRIGIKYLNEYLKAYKLPDSKNKLNQLAKFSELILGVHETSKTKLAQNFDDICNTLMKSLCLVVGYQVYRFTELEIYYFDERNHPDPYTHKDEQQLYPGNFYFNGFGLDITFGNPVKKIYGGILIRGIKNLNTGKFVSGPSNVLKEIFGAIGNVFEARNNICIRELKNGDADETKPLKTSRIGLPQKEELYHGKKYRYLVEICLEHKFKDKQKVLENMIEDKLIDSAKAKEIMGYKLKKT
jgi:hypothetical protein